jgi:hypothetical protein
MKLGAEPKKVAWLTGLMAVAGLVYWMNSSPDTPTASVTPRPAADAAVTPVGGDASSRSVRRQASGHAIGLGEKTFEAPLTVDPTKVDPTLRLDVLAKLEAMPSEGGVRNIFKREAPPPDPASVAAKLDKNIPNPGKIDVTKAPPQPEKAAIQQPPPPAAPTTPPINLKYYGYSKKRIDGEKKAFFLDGDDVIVAAEGEIIKKQYKVVRITDNSVQMEDTRSKSTQTLQIQEAAPV